MKGLIGAALIVVPLLIAAAIAYWPKEPVSVITVVISRTAVHSHNDISDFAEEVPRVLAEELREAAKLTVQIAERNIDQKEAAGFDAVILTSLTEDAGIIQLNVQVISSRTREEIFNKTYHSPHQQFRDMLHAAGDGVRRALN
jgi:uncharacterized NAD(P)/FAD-binding protein YdhS